MRFKNFEDKIYFFDEIYHKYKNQVYRSVDNFTHHANFTEDIVQETFLIVLNKLEQLKDNAKCKSWVHIIAYNEAKRQIAKYNHKLIDFKSEFADEDYIHIYKAASVPSVEDEIILIENANITAKALEMLSYMERQLVVMKYQQGLSYREIGDILEESPNRLKWRMPAILKKMRTEIQKLGGENIE